MGGAGAEGAEDPAAVADGGGLGLAVALEVCAEPPAAIKQHAIVAAATKTRRGWIMS